MHRQNGNRYVADHGLVVSYGIGHQCDLRIDRREACYLPVFGRLALTLLKSIKEDSQFSHPLLRLLALIDCPTTSSTRPDAWRKVILVGIRGRVMMSG